MLPFEKIFQLLCVICFPRPQLWGIASDNKWSSRDILYSPCFSDKKWCLGKACLLLIFHYTNTTDISSLCVSHHMESGISHIYVYTKIMHLKSYFSALFSLMVFLCSYIIIVKCGISYFSSLQCSNMSGWLDHSTSQWSLQNQIGKILGSHLLGLSTHGDWVGKALS